MSPAQPAATSLDLNRAMEFIGDQDRIEDMLRELLRSLQTDVPRIRQALADGAVERAHGLLHPLKGWLPVFCVDRLVDHISMVEIVCRHSTLPGPVRIAFATLEPELARLETELQQRLAAPAA